MNKTIGGASGVGVLQIVFLVLKLTGNINWSWLWVLSPTWIWFLILGIALIWAFWN